MIGEPNNGMAAMFTMMNNARLGVGVQGIGAAEGAFQQALTYRGAGGGSSASRSATIPTCAGC